MSGRSWKKLLRSKSDSQPRQICKKNSMKNILIFLRILKGYRNRRRNSRIRHLGESMAWFNSTTRR